MIKTTLVTSLYNKENELENVLYSIKRQIFDDIDFTICIYDDCSDNDSENLIKKYFDDVIYYRSSKREGPFVSYIKMMNLIPKETEVVIIQAGDIIHINTNNIKLLVDNAGEKKFTTGIVIDYDFPKYGDCDFHKEIKKFLDELPFWSKEKLLTNSRTGIHKRWYFFLGSILYKDLIKFTNRHSLCDVSHYYLMKKNNFKLNLLHLVQAIHQNHQQLIYPCEDFENCRLYCVMKKLFYSLKMNDN